MATRLSRYLDGVMEICWLTAVISVPVFFNVYSSRIFEPDKITLLRSLALLSLVVWIIKLSESVFAGKNSTWNIEKLKSLIRIPLVLPVILISLVYIIASLLSITPWVSFLGSYQRLQGTYSFFSYLVIFVVLVTNIRKESQINRLISSIIISSLPVALYGILQRYRIDPVPWAGEVSIRIAANMGNSIFVAAYLIMVNPLTLVRMLSSFNDILKEQNRIWVSMVKATCYVFIAVLQIIALFLTGSRGPWLGWMVGTFILFILLSLYWRKRWLLFGVIGVGGLLTVLLFVINLPNSPLSKLKTVPGITRFSNLLEAEGGTGRVRVLIWEGASKLVGIHPPLMYPDERQDNFNFIRPLIGYGPESMYVAFNPFYPPELGNLEKRNASPDRSHNETWDSLVTTGIIGLFTYLILFGSVFYYGFKWIGLVNNNRQRLLFVIMCIGGGIIGGIGLISWRGIAYLGVGIPLGMIGGVIIYSLIISVVSHNIDFNKENQLMTLTLIGLISAIFGHFLETNLGIAIAVTRLYFWVYIGLILIIGWVLNSGAQKVETLSHPDINVVEFKPSGSKTKKARRASRFVDTKSKNIIGEDEFETILGIIILGILLSVIGYNFISIGQGGNNAGEILWNSFATLRGATSRSSFGVLALVFTTWLMGGMLLSTNLYKRDESESKNIRNAFWIFFGSLMVGLIFWMLHSSGLAQLINQPTNTMGLILSQVNRYELVLARFYIYIFLLIILGAIVYSLNDVLQDLRTDWTKLAFMLVGGIIAFVFIYQSNLRVIQADIAFKLADPFARGNTWPVAIQIYNRSIELAPREDFYYLFLGRGYLEYAKTITDVNEREKLISQAATDLKKAQSLNPLNTDHTANLARLYSLWASVSTDPEKQKEYSNLSSEYFSKAVVLSPQNARLWDEWALLYLNILQNENEAIRLLNYSANIDPYFDFTHAILGENLLQKAQNEANSEIKTNLYKQAIDQFLKAAENASDIPAKTNYELALAQIYIDTNQLPLAVTQLQDAINLSPTNTNIWRYEQTLSQLLIRLGDKANALIHAQNAYQLAPSDQKTSIEELIQQIQSMP